MASLSITKRLKALEKVANKQSGATVTVVQGVWSATLFAMDLMQIWEGLSPELQATIKAALNNVLSRFVSEINGMAADEQLIQTAELIKVLRTMEKVMRELDPPVLGNYLSANSFQEEFEDTILEARLDPEDLRPGKFRALHEMWQIRSTMARRQGDDVVVPAARL